MAIIVIDKIISFVFLLIQIYVIKNLENKRYLNLLNILKKIHLRINLCVLVL